MTSIAYFGIAGSHTEEAALLYVKKKQLKDWNLTPCSSISEVLSRVVSKKCIGVVPIYNSEGGFIVDYLQCFDPSLHLEIDTVSLEIKNSLLRLVDGNPLCPDAITSHPQALLQCEHYIKKHYPSLPLIEYANTAFAARDLSLGILPKDRLVIASARAAKIYGLSTVANNIQNENNITKFAVVKPATSGAATDRAPQKTITA